MRLEGDEKMDLRANSMISVHTTTNETRLQPSSEVESLPGDLPLLLPSEAQSLRAESQLDLLGPNGSEILNEGLSAFEAVAGVIARTGQNVDLTAAEGDPQIYVGLSAQSVKTISQTSSGRGNDLFPILDLSVELPCGKRWVCAKMDCGCDINIISEHAARRLVDVTILDDSKLGPDNLIRGISRSPVPAYKSMKLNFSICHEGERLNEENLRAVFHVVKDEYTHQAFDVLLGKKLLKALDLLELGKRFRDASQNRQNLSQTEAVSRSAGEATTMTA